MITIESIGTYTFDVMDGPIWKARITFERDGNIIVRAGWLNKDELAEARKAWYVLRVEQPN
jgi:hypothetical protein